ncbi:MAG: shikimate dehydrogenase [Candidatus Humimicrobiaceae bacterium]
MKRISGTTELYALLGNPAKHSLSPFIQNHFFKRYNIDAVYLSFEIDPSEFRAAFNGAQKLGISGLNLTMPFKEYSLEYMDELDENAAATGSVNTIKFDNRSKKINGFNSDIPGLIKSLDDHGFEFKKSNCLIIGAGGSAKSSVYALLKNKIKNIYIYNRNSARADNIKILFDKIHPGKVFTVNDLSQSMAKEINLIINCTPIGMKQDDKPETDEIPIPAEWDLKNKFVFELVYKPLITPFVKKAVRDGADVIYGTELLLNQASFSFEIWTGIYPDLANLKKYFKDSIK